MNGGVRRDAVCAAAHIGNDDLIAEPVHLGEGCPGGHSCRGSVLPAAALMQPKGSFNGLSGVYMAENPANCQCQQYI
jgi:hypothetical protein